MPHFRDCLTMIIALRARPVASSVASMTLIALQALLAGAAETPPGVDYPSNLREVYGAYQAVLARRDTCITAFPKSLAQALRRLTWPGTVGTVSSSRSSISA